MGISYTVMVLQMEMWISNFQHWSTIRGQIITDSIIPLQMNLVTRV